METADVLIIGAGVAGLFTALNLDRRLKTIVIDRQSFPPRKLCGGLMCQDAYCFIKDLNPPAQIFYQPEILRARVRDRDNGLEIYPPEQFHNLNREGFYTWLAGRLQDNVSVKDNSRAIHFQEEQDSFLVTLADREKHPATIRARYLVGAGGYFSAVRRHFFKSEPDYIHSAQYTIKKKAPLEEAAFIFDQSVCRGYYSWIIPRDDRVVVGTAIEGKNYKALPGVLSREYGLAGDVIEVKGHPITKLNSMAEIIFGKGRVLLTGEAAGLVRPSSGEGLTMALQSGQLAADAIRRDPDNPCREYEKSGSVMLPLLARDLQVAGYLFNPGPRKKIFTNR